MDKRKIKISVLSVLLSVFVLMILVVNSDFYKKNEYLRFKELDFRSVVSSKRDEHEVRNNDVILENGTSLSISRVLFDQIHIHDSVIKPRGSDSIYIKTLDSVLVIDYNRFRREKFLSSID